MTSSNHVATPGAAPDVTVVGIGLDGWDGLSPAAREALTSARAVVGSDRQRALVRGHVDAVEHDLPTPLREGLAPLVRGIGAGAVVLATGDPLHYGIGRTLVELLGREHVRILPGISSTTLACARLGWPVESTAVVTLVGRPAERLVPALQDGAHVLVLVADRHGPDLVASILRDAGFGESHLTVLSDLGGASETVADGAAMWWSGEAASDLAVVAVECRGSGHQLTAGLPDDAYETDGQLTKQHVRAATLAALAPHPGQLLWDIGGGTGSIGIEWLRAHPTCRAITVEKSRARAGQVRRNADALAGGRLDVILDKAPEALAELDRPDAVFIGGGVTTRGLLDACIDAVRPGGRVVANTVTLESEAVLLDHYRRLGGTLTRLEVSHADAVGGFTSWNPARPVTQWVWTKSLPA